MEFLTKLFRKSKERTLKRNPILRAMSILFWVENLPKEHQGLCLPISIEALSGRPVFNSGDALVFKTHQATSPEARVRRGEIFDRACRLNNWDLNEMDPEKLTGVIGWAKSGKGAVGMLIIDERINSSGDRNPHGMAVVNPQYLPKAVREKRGLLPNNALVVDGRSEPYIFSLKSPGEILEHLSRDSADFSQVSIILVTEKPHSLLGYLQTLKRR